MRYLKINEIDFSKFNGLIPVIAQSSINKEILMLAFANKNVQVAEFLMTKGGLAYQLPEKDGEGRCGLHYACQKGNLELINKVNSCKNDN